MSCMLGWSKEIKGGAVFQTLESPVTWQAAPVEIPPTTNLLYEC